MNTIAGRILVELSEDSAESREAEIVLVAALTLFGQEVDVDLCLTGVESPTQAHADMLLRVCGGCLPPRAVMPTIDLLGHREATQAPHLLHVRAGGGAFDTARAVVRLGSLAERLREEDTAPPRRAKADVAPPPKVQAQVAARIRARDLDRHLSASGSPPLAVAVVQVQSYWPALASICQALQDDDAVQLEVVALESEHDVRAQRTEDFVRGQGYRPRDAAWFEAQLADRSGPLSLVILDNPYDDIRPQALRSVTLADAGVRVAYSPYSNNNLGAGEHIADMHHDVRMQYDLPLHRVAWRIYVRSQAQKGLHARYCGAGDSHVRVLGMPKLDRVVASRGPSDSPVLQAASDRPVVLWNPHFSFGPKGWSTFDRYLRPILAWFAEHDDVVLLLRPHFRIWRDLRLMAGGKTHALEKEVRTAVRRRDNILLDDSEDYLSSFLASDAMVSDLSSLITEYLPLGKPVLYLHRDDGPGVNEDAEYFFKLDVATEWNHVAAFLHQVRLRADGGIGRRQVLLRDHFGELDGRAGQRVADDLTTGLADELAQLQG